jgi:hypothetical protein
MDKNDDMRLLPWESDTGKPCYLLGDPDGVIATYADRVEERQRANARFALAEAQAVLDEPAAGALALRLALKSATTSLANMLRIDEIRSQGGTGGE